MQVLWDTISSSFKGRGDVINWDIITCTSNFHMSRQVDFSAVKWMDGTTARRTVCGRKRTGYPVYEDKPGRKYRGDISSRILDPLFQSNFWSPARKARDQVRMKDEILTLFI
jgi:hypothetical protein